MKAFTRAMRCRTRCVVSMGTVFFTTLSMALASDPADWPRWRGPHDNGSTDQGSYPVKWDAASVLWKTPLPGKGCSTPIVRDQRIYLTAPTNGLDAVLAFDCSGKPLWQRTLGPEHGKTSQRVGEQSVARHRREGHLRLLQERQPRGAGVRRQSPLADQPCRTIWSRHALRGLRHVAGVDEEIRGHDPNTQRRVVAGGIRQGDRPDALEGAAQFRDAH